MNASMQSAGLMQLGPMLAGLLLAVLPGGESAAQPAEAARAARASVPVRVREQLHLPTERPADPDRHGTLCAQVPGALGKRQVAPGSCEQGQANETAAPEKTDRPTVAPAKPGVGIGFGGITINLDPSIFARRPQPREPKHESGPKPEQKPEPAHEPAPEPQHEPQREPAPKPQHEPTPQPRQPPPKALPDLRGMSCQAAANALAVLHAQYTRCETGASVGGYGPGRINGQSLAPGAVLPLRMALVLSVQPAPTPPRTVEVPALLGLAESQALQQLRARGLQASPNGPPAAIGRRVIGQAPGAGAKVAPGSGVGLRMGLTVPSLLGLDCASARQAAAGYGHAKVQCESRPADSPGRPVAKVFEQDPPSDRPAQPAPAAIRVVVWATHEVTVPDVVGSPLAEARDELTQAHFDHTADAADLAGDRFVIRQTPSPGARAPEGSKVALYTERRPLVPDLLGPTCEEARAAVAPGTFTLKCEDEKSWRTQVFGKPRIAVQSPPGGARAALPVEVGANATVRLPPGLGWLAGVSAPVAVVEFGTSLLLALGFVVWLVRPVASPVPPLSTHWRVEPDTDPAVGLRMAGADPAGRHARSATAWRVVPDAGVVTLREVTTEEGAPHDHR